MNRESAYQDVYYFLHYEYNTHGKTKEQIIQDIKAYCVRKAKEEGK